MFRNYLHVALRFILRNRRYSLINIFGLAFGMALSLLMFKYIYSEFTYDDFHQFKDQIYRVTLGDETTPNSGGIAAEATAGIGPSFLDDFPEVENMVRFSYSQSGFFTWQDKNIGVSRILNADSSVFDVFTFPLLYGNPESTLREPFTIVLTEETAHKIFNRTDVVGEVLKYNNEYDLKVTGVVKNSPANSHLRFNALISFTTLYALPNVYLDWNGGHSYYTYIQLIEGASVDELRAKLPAFTDRHINNDVGTAWSLYLEPLSDVHLYSNASTDWDSKGNLSKLYNFLLLSVFVLLIAAINFVNLSTAQSLKRAREVGLRKVVGANRRQLIMQFLGESLLLSFIALIFSFLLIELFEPAFNTVMQTNIKFFAHFDAVILLIVVTITLMTGLAAGSVPAFYISGFKPVISIKGLNLKKGKPLLRDALVVFQFLISIIIIISTFVIYNQIHFMQKKGLGFNKENIVTIELPSEAAMRNVELIKSEFLKIPGVEMASASTALPGNGLTQNGYQPEGMDHWIMSHVIDVDSDFLPMMGIEVTRGRNFIEGNKTDETTFLINETLAKQLGWENPVGKKIMRNGEHKIIGVVSDFHFAPLNQNIEPLIITNNPWDYFYQVSLKINPNSTSGIIASLEDKWQQIQSGEPFTYSFLSEDIAANYTDESRIGTAFIYLSVISVIIACLGLFAQVSYSSEQRKKEIGIRKVIGATVKNIIFHLTGNFAKIVIIANIIAWPIAWYVMSIWLNKYAFHIGIQWWIFVMVLVLSMLITTLTVFTNAWKVANDDPVKAIKYE